jgi:hypothetical protein
VDFIEGPSQRTLPQYPFPEKLQLALLDGPHAYPFPDLEYYFLYPHLEENALLILDDIHIPTIHNLFDFLRVDAMFRLDEVVRTTAFFTRTAAPTFDPLGDGWGHQAYNQRTLLRYDWRSRLAASLPRSVLRTVSAFRHRDVRRGDCSVEILMPAGGEIVAKSGSVEGRALVPSDGNLWVLVHRKDVDGWWPQAGGPVSVRDGRWAVQVTYGGPPDAGFPFEIAAVIVAPSVHAQWQRWVQSVEVSGLCPPVSLPLPPAVLAETYRTVRKHD